MMIKKDSFKEKTKQQQQHQQQQVYIYISSHNRFVFCFCSSIWCFNHHDRFYPFPLSPSTHTRTHVHTYTPTPTYLPTPDLMLVDISNNSDIAVGLLHIKETFVRNARNQFCICRCSFIMQTHCHERVLTQCHQFIQDLCPTLYISDEIPLYQCPYTDYSFIVVSSYWNISEWWSQLISLFGFMIMFPVSGHIVLVIAFHLNTFFFRNSVILLFFVLVFG